MSMTAPTTGPTVGNAPRRETVNEFGATLRRIRQERGFSQKKLGERSGYDHSYISYLESGKRPPPKNREVVEAFCDVLKLDDDAADDLHVAAGMMTSRMRFWWNRDMRPRRAN